VSAASITMPHRVEWVDTDAGGRIHNTFVFRCFEAAETRLLSRLNLLDEVYGRLPRVHLQADIGAELRFWDEVEVEVRVGEVGRTSITYEFEIRAHPDAGSVARGRVVASLRDADGGPDEWPDAWRRRLLEAGPQPEAPP
jgi:acyl-CoA thioesterase FadM